MFKYQLLLADDDEMLASLLKFRFNKEGYEVHQCHDGKQVKDYLSQNHPDVIVSDIMMPYFSGIELIGHIRNDLKLEIPIIIISSAGNEENILSAFDMGANDFIAKPVSPAELMVRVSKQLRNT
jgi:DNA-binding response OmpR family regulator